MIFSCIILYLKVFHQFRIDIFSAECCETNFVLSGQALQRPLRCAVFTIQQVRVRPTILFFQRKSFSKHVFDFYPIIAGMPGAGSQYSVMGRPQDPRSSMFGSSINLNGEFSFPCFVAKQKKGNKGYGKIYIKPAP